MNYFDRAKALVPELTGHRRWLHQHPELGMDLPETLAYVKSQLEAIGCAPVPCGGGLTALIGEKRPGPVLLLRADMDALPMREESGLPFASQRDAAHTCGHDTHTAMLLLAARLLKEREEELPGTVKLMFQPGEEILAGARSMIEAGVLENPHVDAAVGMHIIGGLAPVGAVFYSVGPTAASSDTFEIRITGKGGHGAMPHSAVDPISIAAHLVVDLQELNAREIDPGESAVLTFGELHAGSADNIIPDAAVLRGTMRSYDSQVRSQMRERLTDMAQLCARMYRGEAQVEFKASAAALICDEAVVHAVRDALRQQFGDRAVQPLPQRLTGSEDFAEVSQRVPTAFLALGAGTPQDGCQYGQHHPKVIFREEALPVGAAAYAQAAEGWLRSMAKS